MYTGGCAIISQYLDLALLVKRASSLKLNTTHFTPTSSLPSSLTLISHRKPCISRPVFPRTYNSSYLSSPPPLPSLLHQFYNQKTRGTGPTLAYNYNYSSSNHHSFSRTPQPTQIELCCSSRLVHTAAPQADAVACLSQLERVPCLTYSILRRAGFR
jgi:hypothetical protein